MIKICSVYLSKLLQWETDEQYLSKVSDVMHSLFSTHGATLLPLFDQLLPTFASMLVSEPERGRDGGACALLIYALRPTWSALFSFLSSLPHLITPSPPLSPHSLTSSLPHLSPHSLTSSLSSLPHLLTPSPPLSPHSLTSSLPHLLSLLTPSSPLSSLPHLITPSPPLSPHFLSLLTSYLFSSIRVTLFSPLPPLLYIQRLKKDRVTRSSCLSVSLTTSWSLPAR